MADLKHDPVDQSLIALLEDKTLTSTRRLEQLRHLLQLGAFVWERDATPLYVAAHAGDVEATTELLKTNCNLWSHSNQLQSRKQSLLPEHRYALLIRAN